MALRKSNVETFIVFRASTPLAVAALDYVFLGRSAPSSQALASLIATAVAASAYVATDAQFYVEGFAGYSWCFLYFALICFEMTFGKHLTSALRLGVWESVWLTTLLALPLLAALAYVRGDLEGFGEKLVSMSMGDAVVLVVVGRGHVNGYAGWLCRPCRRRPNADRAPLHGIIGDRVPNKPPVAPGRPGPGLPHRGVVAVQGTSLLKAPPRPRAMSFRGFGGVSRSSGARQRRIYGANVCRYCRFVRVGGLNAASLSCLLGPYKLQPVLNLWPFLPPPFDRHAALMISFG